MKQVINLFSAFLILLTAPCFAQSVNNNLIPELIFQNPVLTSGTAGQDGAVYKFSNVATGIDATVKVMARSSTLVKLTNIDVSNMGWTKAFQPQLGIPGNVAANQDWWMDFEMRFYKAGTDEKKKIKGFNVSAIDVDGDGVSIQEYVQMNKIKSVAYCPVNSLVEKAPVTLSGNEDDDDDDNKAGTNKKAQGPAQNFYNIDTLGTPVMATYTYEDKDKISFRYGAKSGSIISNAGERLNSLWFKSFNLTPPSTLPIVFQSFTASYDKRNTDLNWTAQADDNFSYFVVERSIDGTKFEKVGQLQASDGTNNYSFTDPNASSLTGILYYRILSSEKSGEVAYSSIKIVRLRKEAGTALAVYPNPVQGIANLTLPANWQNKPVTASIYNAAGMQVQNISIKRSSQTEALNFQQLPKGIYLVKAQCDGQWAEHRIVKN